MPPVSRSAPCSPGKEKRDLPSRAMALPSPVVFSIPQSAQDRLFTRAETRLLQDEFVLQRSDALGLTAEAGRGPFV